MATEEEATKAAAAAVHADYVVEGAERNLAAVSAKITQAADMVDSGAAQVAQAQAALDDVAAERELLVAESANLNPGAAANAGSAEATGQEN
jgi:cell division protein FtsB